MNLKPKLLVPMLGIALLATGCATKPALEPDDVIAHTGKQLLELMSADFEIDLNLNGGLSSNIIGNIDTADIALQGTLDTTVGDYPAYRVNSTIIGGNSRGKIRLSGQVVGLPDNTYFQLADVSIPTLVPISLGGDNNWYRINTESSQSPLPQIAGDQISDLEENLSSTVPFTITETLPVSFVNGERVYHYKAKFNPESIKLLSQSLPELPAEFPDLEFLSDYEPDIYISYSDFEIVRIAATGVYVHGNSPTAFDLTLNLKNHNSTTQILAPESSKQIDNPNQSPFSGFGF
ncbi:MAG: hypothetical protein R3B38_01750 [Patescibacteria group bacterium]